MSSLLFILLLLLLLTLWPPQLAEATSAAPTRVPTPAPSLAAVGPNPWYGSQSNHILYNGKYYSLLSNALIDDSSVLCQNWYINLPGTWKVAPDNADTRTLITQHYWSTHVVVLASGVGIWGLGGAAGSVFGSGFLQRSGSSYYVSSCSLQILLIYEAPVYQITYNGKLYATLGGTPANSNSFSCYSTLTMPANWVVAPHNQDTIAIISSYPWGTKFLSLANNQAFNSYPSPGVLQGSPGYSVSGTSYTASICDSQVLIMYLPSTPFNTYTYKGKLYSTLADVQLTSSAGTFSQNYYLSLPPGWVIAPHSQDALYVIWISYWSSSYMILADGCVYTVWLSVPTDCGYLLTIGTTYATSTTYTSQILIVKQADPVNTYTYNSRTYATLADVLTTNTAALNSQIDFCHNYPLSLPPNWVIASDNADSRYVCSQMTFSNYIILANGYVIYTGYNVGIGGTVISSSNYLQSNAGSTYQVSSGACNAQILIVDSRTTANPSFVPTYFPTILPSKDPTYLPTRQPSADPTHLPTKEPTPLPSFVPTTAPSAQPTYEPSTSPSADPTYLPTKEPTPLPSFVPTIAPSAQPTYEPSISPSASPTYVPTFAPTPLPTPLPTSQPSNQPSCQPSFQPSRQPSSQPSTQPSFQPSRRPSTQPTSKPSMQPSMQPSSQPSAQPTSQPSFQPSTQPTAQPSNQPSSQPTSKPSSQPSFQPSSQPSRQPSISPSTQPSFQPSSQPSRQPSMQPSQQPTSQPSSKPSRQPTLQPSRKPTSQPFSRPSMQPSMQPSSQPSVQPTMQPSSQPTSRPSAQPSLQPSSQPSIQPSRQPSSQPSRQPSSQPSSQPSTQPSIIPSTQPTIQPSSQPSLQPSSRPSSQPSIQPSSKPSIQPSLQPSSQPSLQPSSQPSILPSRQPSSQPSLQPSSLPSSRPSMQPSLQPSLQPSSQPSMTPSRQPSSQPSMQPSLQPSSQPSSQPSAQPSLQPSMQPTSRPSRQPSSRPSQQPSMQPTSLPSMQPSALPTRQPSAQPSRLPTAQPSRQPSAQPSIQPSSLPSQQPSMQPTSHPSRQPSVLPTMQPSTQPSLHPSGQPSRQPTMQPSSQPSMQPSSSPTTYPSAQPSMQPTMQPSRQPSLRPSSQPSTQPSMQPTTQPSRQPSSQPSSRPSNQPSTQPSAQPSSQPSRQPTSQPSLQPSTSPSNQPSIQPSFQPSRRPSTVPSSQPSRQPSLQPTVQPSSIPSTQPSAIPSFQPSTQPSRLPTCQPSTQPTMLPTNQPSRQPTRQPSSQPSSQPSRQPSNQPSSSPLSQPTIQPSSQPSSLPTQQPSLQPSSLPTSQPSMQPTNNPSCQPSITPSSLPTSQPSRQPSRQPSSQPSRQPSLQPIRDPTSRPSMQPSRIPTSQPSLRPSTIPSCQPSRQPSLQPSNQPSALPSSQPSMQPSRQPSSQPSMQPYAQPSRQPSPQPSMQPSSQPQGDPSSQPSRQPSTQPSKQPSRRPTSRPSRDYRTVPSSQPTSFPTNTPTSQPTSNPSSPSNQPSSFPSQQPSSQPSRIPSSQPSSNPSQPSSQPSRQPTVFPSSQPSRQPSIQPSCQPSRQPSTQPSMQPTTAPSSQPSRLPSTQPSMQPSSQPSRQPSQQPFSRPSSQPSRQPSSQPSCQPSSQPSVQPSLIPTNQPSSIPSSQPTMHPSSQPTTLPSRQPTTQPTHQPSSQPTRQPSSQPSRQPTKHPSSQPSSQPSQQPSLQPVNRPSSIPSVQPSIKPSLLPTMQPSTIPSSQPLSVPSSQPSLQPSSQPSRQPSLQPSSQPSFQPLARPSSQPSLQPSTLPSSQPSMQPSRQPSSQPSRQPSSQPSSQPSNIKYIWSYGVYNPTDDKVRPSLTNLREFKEESYFERYCPEDEFAFVTTRNCSLRLALLQCVYRVRWLSTTAEEMERHNERCRIHFPPNSIIDLGGDFVFDLYSMHSLLDILPVDKFINIEIDFMGSKVVVYNVFMLDLDTNKYASNYLNRISVELKNGTFIRKYPNSMLPKSYVDNAVSRASASSTIRNKVNLLTRSQFRFLRPLDGYVHNSSLYSMDLPSRDIAQLTVSNVYKYCMNDVKFEAVSLLISTVNETLVLANVDVVNTRAVQPTTSFKIIYTSVNNLTSSAGYRSYLDGSYNEKSYHSDFSGLYIYKVGNFVNLSSLSFANNIGFAAGGGLSLDNIGFAAKLSPFCSNSDCEKARILIQDSHFVENMAFSGSAVFINLDVLTNLPSSYSSLFPFKSGEPSYDSALIKFTNCTFKSNRAFVAGTIFQYVEVMRRNIENAEGRHAFFSRSFYDHLIHHGNNTFDANIVGYYGDKVGSNFYRIFPDTTSTYVKDYTSGSFPIKVSLRAVDVYLQSIPYGSKVFARFNRNITSGCLINQPTTFGVASSAFQSGVASFDKLGANCFPGGSAKIEFYTQILVESKFMTAYYYHDLYFRQCRRGEYFDTSSVSASTCALCMDSFSTKDFFDGKMTTSCEDCPALAEDCRGDQIVLSPGTWRYSSSTVNPILTCFSALSCKGGNETGDLSCSETSYGPICGLCKDGYFMRSDDCKKCGPGWAIILPIMLSLVAVALLVYILYLPRVVAVTEHITTHVNIAPYIQVVLITFQVIALGSSGNSIGQSSSKTSSSSSPTSSSSPSSSSSSSSESNSVASNMPLFSVLLNSAAVLNFDLFTTFSISCLVNYNFFNKLVIMTLLPLSICAIGLITIGIVTIAIHDKVKRANLSNPIIAVIIFMFYYSLAPISNLIFSTFNCFDVDPYEAGRPANVADSQMHSDYYSTLFLMSDLTISCESTEYNVYSKFAAIMIVIYPIGVPLSIFMLLNSYRAIVESKQLIDKLGSSVLVRPRRGRLLKSLHLIHQLDVFFKAYSPKYWYFEVVDVVQRLIVSSVLKVLFSYSDEARFAVSALISLLIYQIFKNCNPYTDTRQNALSNMGKFQIFLSFMSTYCVISGTLNDVKYGYLMVDIIICVTTLSVVIISAKLGFEEYQENTLRMRNTRVIVEDVVLKIGNFDLQNLVHTNYVERTLKFSTTVNLLKLQGVVFLQLIKRCQLTSSPLKQGKVAFATRLTFPEKFNSSLDYINHFVLVQEKYLEFRIFSHNPSKYKARKLMEVSQTQISKRFPKVPELIQQMVYRNENTSKTSSSIGMKVKARHESKGPLTNRIGKRGVVKKGNEEVSNYKDRGFNKMRNRFKSVDSLSDESLDADDFLADDNLASYTFDRNHTNGLLHKSTGASPTSGIMPTCVISNTSHILNTNLHSTFFIDQKNESSSSSGLENLTLDDWKRKNRRKDLKMQKEEGERLAITDVIGNVKNKFNGDILDLYDDGDDGAGEGSDRSGNSEVKPDLPKGWIQVLDTLSGRHYYKNHDVVQWHRPSPTDDGKDVLDLSLSD